MTLERAVPETGGPDAFNAVQTIDGAEERYEWLVDRRDTLRAIQNVLIPLVCLLMLVVLYLEFAKARQDRFYIVLEDGDEETRLAGLRDPKRAMAELERLAAEHNVPHSAVHNVALTRIPRFNAADPLSTATLNME